MSVCQYGYVYYAHASIAFFLFLQKYVVHCIQSTLASGRLLVIDWFSFYSQNGWTPLMQACSEGHVKVVERLVAAKADLNQANKVG